MSGEYGIFEVRGDGAVGSVYDRFNPVSLADFYYGELVSRDEFIGFFRCGAVLLEVQKCGVPVGIITGVAATPSCMRMGIASYTGKTDIGAFEVMPRLESRLLERGICVIVAEIPAFKVHVRLLMKRFGFNLTGEIPGYFGRGDDLLIYTKKLV